VASHRRSVGHSLNPKLMEVGWFLYISPFREMLVRSAVIFFVLLLWPLSTARLACPARRRPNIQRLPLALDRGIIGHARPHPSAENHFQRDARQRRARCSGLLCRPQMQHSIEMSADRWAEDIRLSDIEEGFICQACGKRGADVRPHFAPARMGTA
jgi:hypothetical protein